MISIRVDGVTAIVNKLDNIKVGLSDGKLAAQLAVKQAKLIKDGTRAGGDIKGARFKPLVLRVGNPLDDSGAMLRSVKAIQINADTAAVVLGAAKENLKGTAHQYGTGIYNSRGSAERIKRRSGGRALGPIKTQRVNEWNAKIKKGKAFFTSVKGTPVRKWFGFRPGDKEKLMEEAKKILSNIISGKGR